MRVIINNNVHMISCSVCKSLLEISLTDLHYRGNYFYITCCECGYETKLNTESLPNCWEEYTKKLSLI